MKTTIYTDKVLKCVVCDEEFTWTVGQQVWHRAKELVTPPRKCSKCRELKNQWYKNHITDDEYRRRTNGRG